MKRILAAALAVLILFSLSACAKEQEEHVSGPEPTLDPEPALTPEPTPAPDQFVFTRENFPIMDGSTAMIPLAEAAASVLLGEPRDAVAELVSFNRTTQSFRNLAYGACDILIVGEPAESVWSELEGFDVEMAHIATDALVFVVSADNPVDSLTAEQLRGIYTGEITNWSEIGGNDVDIIPFQRNAEAGSQAAMLRLVMEPKGLEMMKPPVDYVIDSMMGLMEAVRSFDGSEGAIGYSVYYYANDMRMAEGLKMIAVDGVEPEPETIRAAEYPFLAKSYTVISASAALDSPERMMYEWLIGEEGQRLIERQGYVSVGG